MVRTGGVGGVLGIHVRKWVLSLSPSSRSHPAGIEQFMAQRGFAQERPEDSSTSNWGAGEPPIDEKNTERGVAPGSQESQQLRGSTHPNMSRDSEGQTKTPNLSEEKTTRDFINIQREARAHVSEGSEPASEVAPEGTASQAGFQKKGATPADVAAG